jgi:hypothetical protein
MKKKTVAKTEEPFYCEPYECDGVTFEVCNNRQTSLVLKKIKCDKTGFKSKSVHFKCIGCKQGAKVKKIMEVRKEIEYREMMR